SRRSGKRPGKKVVVETDNDDKSIDVNNETFDDDFVEMGRRSSHASVSRRSGKRPRKEVVVETDNDDKSIDVNDETSDDDFVEMGRRSSHASGLRRSGRNKDKELYVVDHAKSVAFGSKGKGQNQGRKRSRETTRQKAEKRQIVIKLRVSSPRALCNAILQLKPNQKACLEEIGFAGMVGFKVDGIPSKLGLYVVNNFDEENMEIKLSKGSILITKKLIGDMLGLKNEGFDVLEGKPNRDEEMVRSWMLQYGDDKEITPADVKMRLRKSDEADINFKLNFIVLFASIMGNTWQRGAYVLTRAKKDG
ncbi:hypothetical protein Tco_0999774, partial [Tanacetum coccineum]